MPKVRIEFDAGNQAEEIANAISQAGAINYTSVEGNTVQVAVGTVTVEE